MTEPETEYGERLRRALRAAADGVVPSGDGLERIRSRIAHEPARDTFGLLLGWLRSLAADVRSSMPDIRSVLPALKSLLPLVKSVAAAIVPLISSLRAIITSVVVRLKSVVPERLRGSDGWLRPVLATAGAVVVALIVAFVAIPGFRQGFYADFGGSGPDTSSTQPAGHHGTGGAVPGATGPSTPATSPSLGTSTAPASPCRAKSTPAAHLYTSSRPRTCPRASSSPAPTRAALTPTPTPTATASPSPSPSPSPTPSATPSPTPTSSAPATGGSSGTATQATTQSTATVKLQ